MGMAGDEKGRLERLLEEAREASWAHFGKRIAFYLPGMVRYGGERGRYPALSITGPDCRLNCEHCKGEVLRPMVPATTPEALIEKCLQIAAQGNYGCLLTGGCMEDGSLPWASFMDAIAEVKRRTNLWISIHSGLIDNETARGLKRAGIDQALIEVIGDGKTWKEVYHLDNGMEAMERSLHALFNAGLEVVPHIVVGLYFGRIEGEFRALEITAAFNPRQMAIVSLMPISGTPMKGVRPPEPEEIAEVIATARLLMPTTLISLGCARSRGKESSRIEDYAVDAGVNRMAIPSDSAMERARYYGLEMAFYNTCCSVPGPMETGFNE